MEILSDKFSDPSEYSLWDNLLFPHELHYIPEVTGKRMQQVSEKQVKAYEEGNCKDCCMLGVAMRVRSLGRDCLRIPLSCVWSLGQCVTGLGACVCAVLGATAATGLLGLLAGEGDAEGVDGMCKCIGGCCVAGGALCAMGCWTSVFCCTATSLSLGGCLCPELQRYLGQGKLELYFEDVENSIAGHLH